MTARALFPLLFCALSAQAQSSSLPTSAPSTMPASVPSTAPTSIVVGASNPKQTETAEPVLCATNEAISILPLAFRRAGFSAQYERQLVSKPYSMAGALGMRFGAREPLRSPQYSLGVELKRWRSLAFWKEKGALYGVGRFDIGVARLLGESKIGSSLLMESHFGFGYRRVIAEKIEVSAASTMGIRTDIDRSGLLPAQFTGTIGFWLSVGYLF
jgi:hypothetical protein